MSLKDVTKIEEVKLLKEIAELTAKLGDVGSIAKRLQGIEEKLTEVITLKERVAHYGEALSRFGSRLDEHDHRLRELEIWKANRANSYNDVRLIFNNIEKIENDIAEMKNDKSRITGQKDVVKEILKWTSALLSAIIIWLITQ